VILNRCRKREKNGCVLVGSSTEKEGSKKEIPDDGQKKLSQEMGGGGEKVKKKGG